MDKEDVVHIYNGILLSHKKEQNRSTIQPSNSAPGYLSKENEDTNLKRYMHLYVHCSTVYNSQDMEAA